MVRNLYALLRSTLSSGWQGATIFEARKVHSTRIQYSFYSKKTWDSSLRFSNLPLEDFSLNIKCSWWQGARSSESTFYKITIYSLQQRKARCSLIFKYKEDKGSAKGTKLKVVECIRLVILPRDTNEYGSSADCINISQLHKRKKPWMFSGITLIKFRIFPVFNGFIRNYQDLVSLWKEIFLNIVS